MRVRGRILSQTIKGPYLAVCLWKNGITSMHTPVQRIMARAFLGPCPDGQLIRHLNGDGHDNRLSNLRYGTPSQNMRDSVEHGTHWLAKRDRCKHGHEYTSENTTIRYRNGWECRVCKTCVKVRSLSRSERHKDPV